MALVDVVRIGVAGAGYALPFAVPAALAVVAARWWWRRRTAARAAPVDAAG